MSCSFRDVPAAGVGCSFVRFFGLLSPVGRFVWTGGLTDGAEPASGLTWFKSESFQPVSFDGDVSVGLSLYVFIGALPVIGACVAGVGARVVWAAGVIGGVDAGGRAGTGADNVALGATDIGFPHGSSGTRVMTVRGFRTTYV